jgi:two-component system response regulator QseB
MSSAGHETDWASNQYEAELSMQRGDYDVVLLSLGLSGIDASDLLRRYRCLRGNASVVAMIDRDALESPLVALDAGADDYLLKPFALTDLSARMRISCGLVDAMNNQRLEI